MACFHAAGWPLTLKEFRTMTAVSLLEGSMYRALLMPFIRGCGAGGSLLAGGSGATAATPFPPAAQNKFQYCTPVVTGSFGNVTIHSLLTTVPSANFQFITFSFGSTVLLVNSPCLS